MRILHAKKSKYYGAALGHFEDAKACYERAALARFWDVLVAEVRGAHRRKAGFMADFERLVAGQGPGDEPSFLERAKSGGRREGRRDPLMQPVSSETSMVNPSTSDRTAPSASGSRSSRTAAGGSSIGR
jgi:hypothetical protein